MITLIRRELLDNLMTFRFAAAVFIMLLLVVATTAVLIRDYEKRLTSYNTAVKKHRQEMLDRTTYSAARLTIDRPPNPLSIFNVGLDKRLGNVLGVNYFFVPTLWDADKHGADNPFLNLFSSIDLVFIFQGILSLLALVFAYDTLAGERERGTLRLVLTHPIRHGQILFAKYISGMICLLIPLLMCVLLVLIMLTTSASVFLSTDDFLRIGGVVFTSFIYLSLFYLIGMLISAATRRTGTALMLAMFVWGFLVLVYPNMILTAIKTEPHPDTTLSAYNRIKQIWEEFDRDRLQYLANDPVPGEKYDFGLRGEGYPFRGLRDYPSSLLYYHLTGFNYKALKAESEPLVPHVQDYFRFFGTQVTNTAERIWLVRKPALDAFYTRPAKIEQMLLKFSPVGLYDAATEAWTGTDLNALQDFFRAVQRYHQAVIDYYLDNKIFESRLWFVGAEGDIDWNLMPQFSFKRSDIGINAKRALPDLCLLLMINLVLFAIIFLIFVRSEV
ncbi:MAG: ABC transporter permease subunit [Candidatus Poribacteria bacterium]|nr:ABC transporter permease subunit [Candidatus Poribacteria bacterium]